MGIKLILEIFNSKRDLNGNTYWAFVLTDVASGKKVYSALGGSARGNAEYYVGQLGYDWDEIHVIGTEMGKREFYRMVNDWPYISKPGDLIAAFKAQGVKIGKPKKRR